MLDGAGRVQACPQCGMVDYAATCGLGEAELRATSASIGGSSETHVVLRHLVDRLVAEPVGWLTLWGPFGTAKTLTVQAIVAGLVHRGVQARFYHAKRLEQGWFDDINGDSANGQMYRRLRVLAIDEADKINTRSDWTRAAFQELMDDRYRSGLAGNTCTLVVSQGDPAQCLPGDIASRMADGRFYRPWEGGRNHHAVERWGARWIPGIVHVEGQDMRPHMRPGRREQ